MKCKAVMLIISAQLLFGCGGTGQDDGVVRTASTIRGVAVDGYLASATCYLDENENFKRDAFEASAITDIEGYYTFNPNSGIDYCGSTATEDQAQHCLQSLSNVNQAPLRCEGGYDILTEEPFEGTLSTRISVTVGTAVENVVVSPLTTMYASATTDSERAQVLDALNVTSETELSVDYIANRDSSLLQTALRIQKMAQVLAEPIRATHDSSAEAKVDPVGQVYEALVNYIVDNSETDISTVLTDTTALASVASSAESLFIAAEQIADEDFTAGTNVTTANRNLSSQRAVQVVQVATALCSDQDSDNSFSDAEMKGCARATEVVLKKVVEELEETTLISDSSIDTAVSCLTSSSCNDLLQVLGTDNFDLGAIQEDDFSVPAQTAISATIPTDATAFSSLAGSSLRVNDPDNAIPAETKHARLELYFGEGSTTNSGSLTACIRYIDGTGFDNPNRTTDDDLEDGDTRGAFVTGNWRILGSSGYSVLLNLSITETSEPYSAIVKSAGTNSNGIQVFRFDFDEGLEDWLSVNGVENQPNPLPTTNTLCRERFNNVVDSI